MDKIDDEKLFKLDQSTIDFAKNYPDQFKLIMEKSIEMEKTKQMAFSNDIENKKLETEGRKMDLEKYKIDHEKYKIDAQNKFELDKLKISEEIEKEKTRQTMWSSVCGGIADISISALNKSDLNNF